MPLVHESGGSYIRTPGTRQGYPVILIAKHFGTYCRLQTEAHDISTSSHKIGAVLQWCRRDYEFARRNFYRQGAIRMMGEAEGIASQFPTETMPSLAGA